MENNQQSQPVIDNNTNQPKPEDKISIDQANKTTLVYQDEINHSKKHGAIKVIAIILSVIDIYFFLEWFIFHHDLFAPIILPILIPLTIIFIILALRNKKKDSFSTKPYSKLGRFALIILLVILIIFALFIGLFFLSVMSNH